MDNNKIQEFINGVGALTEMWTITYHSFRQQGLAPEQAITHTGALIRSLVMPGEKGKED